MKNSHATKARKRGITARVRAKAPKTPLPFVPIPTNLKRRPQYQAFCAQLGVESNAALAPYVNLLLYAAEYHIWGELPPTTAKRLALNCEWDGDPDALLAAFTGSGLLVDQGKHWWITGWDELVYPILAKRLVAAERSRANTLRMAVVQKHGTLCAYCGQEAVPMHIDHVVPLSRGGKSTLANLVVACGPCNIRKGANLVADLDGTMQTPAPEDAT